MNYGETKQNGLASLMHALGVAAFLARSNFAVANAAENVFAPRTGVVVTPRNLPNQSAADLADMFRLDADLGCQGVMRVSWNGPQCVEAARATTSAAGTARQPRRKATKTPRS
jgi:hypothetical protein